MQNARILELRFEHVGSPFETEIQPVCRTLLCGAHWRPALQNMPLISPEQHNGGGHIKHPALALGNNAHAAQGIGMTDMSRRQPAGDPTPHTIPDDTTILPSPRQPAMPKPPHLETH